MNTFDFEFIIPLKRDDLLVCQSSNQYRVSEVYHYKELNLKIEECMTSLKETGCDFVVEHFGTLFSVLQNFKNLDFKFLQSFYINVTIEGLKLLNSTLYMILEDDDFHSDLRVKMLNVTKMMFYFVAEFLKSFQEKVDITYSLVIDKKGKKNTKLMKLKEDHNWDWEENERLALSLMNSTVKLPLQRLWDPPMAEKEFIRMVEDCCYFVLEKPAVTSVKMKPTRDIIFEILAVLIKQYNNAISCKVKIVQMLKLYEHLVSILAQAVVFFVTNYNCQSLVKELIIEIIETSGEIDTFGQDTSSSRTFSNFIVEIATLQPELILPCINLLIHSLNCDPYSMRICVLTVMSEVVINVLRSDAENDLSDDKRKTRDNFLEHLLDHIVDVNVFVRSRVLKLWQTMCKKKAVPKHYIIPLLEQTIQRLYDKSTNVTKNAVQLIKVMLEDNLYGAVLDVEVVKQNLCALKSKLIGTEIEKPVPSKFKIWFYSRLEISEYIVRQIEDAENESTDSKPKPVSKKRERANKENESMSEEEEKEEHDDDDENVNSNVLSEQVLQIQNYVVAQDIENLFKHLSKFEDKYLTRLGLLTKKSEKVQYFEWILGHLCKEDCTDDLLKKIRGCDKQSKLKLLLNEAVQVDDLQDLEFGSDKTVVTYCEDFLRFIETLSAATSVIGDLMMGNSSVEVLEAIEFFEVAKQFSLSGVEEGFRNMLLLINSKEPTVKEAVVNAYKTLYLHSERTDETEIAEEAVEKLIVLLKTVTYEQKTALGNLIKQWVINNDIGTDFILVLWDKYARKSNTSYEDSIAAAVLISMYASGKPEVIRSNVDLLTKYGLSNENRKHYSFSKYTLSMFRTLTGIKNENGSLAKYPTDCALLDNLLSIIEQEFSNFDNNLYVEIALEAVTTIYRLFEVPDMCCGNLLKTLCKKLVNDSEKADSENEIVCREELLTRFVMIIGHVAFCQWQYIENDILEELKRRNTETQSNEMKTKKQVLNKSKNRSDAERKSFTENNVTDNFEDDYTVMANERITESARLVCESEILFGDRLIAKLCALVLAICQNPEKYSGDRLRSAATVALSKMMIISSEFCEKHIQLFVTLMEKTSQPEVKINLILAFGDLTFRFPNIVEPWTIYFYNRLNDVSTDVRCTALIVISHLITNEMVKVKSQMSDVALCLVDSYAGIRNRAYQLFYELGAKGNTLYNVMADIISRLSHPDHRTTEQNYQSILKILMKLIVKDRHLESIVEKLCHRLRGAVDERQCIDLSYCLTLVTYTDRSLQKLIDNLVCFADKLNYARVRKHFANVIIACKKQSKVNKLNDLVQELENKIDIILTKGIDNLDADFLKPASKTPMKSARTPRASKSTGVANRFRTVNPRNAKRIVIHDESEEESSDNEE